MLVTLLLTSCECFHQEVKHLVTVSNSKRQLEGKSPSKSKANCFVKQSCNALKEKKYFKGIRTVYYKYFVSAVHALKATVF